MAFSTGFYCGDRKMAELLKNAGARCTLHGVYGLFHGCIAAPHMVLPSGFLHLILEKDGEEFEINGEAEEFFAALMNLWNRISRWDPEKEPFRWPSLDFPPAFKGLKNRAEQCGSFITHFIKGLELGGTLKSDFEEDALCDPESIKGCRTFLMGCSELPEAGEEGEDEDFQKAMELMDRYENLIGLSIARINLGLKPARMRVLDEMCGLVELEKRKRRTRSVKIGRNDPCPCGSGRKYKKCCMDKETIL